MKYFDSHCHLNYGSFESDWEDVAARAAAAGVTRINNIGTELESAEAAIALAKQRPELFTASAGIHPTHVSESYYRENQEQAVLRLRQFAVAEEVRAIGETGLDYHYLVETTEKEGLAESKIKQLQHEYLGRLLQLAGDLNKPLIFHCRDAYEDFYEVLKKELDGQTSVIHFYIGTNEMLKKFIDLGLYIGFTGVITYPKTDGYAENVQTVPLDRILIETDAPFAPPVPYRGQRNEPAYVAEVARRIAEIKQISLEEVADQTTANAELFFGL